MKGASGRPSGAVARLISRNRRGSVPISTVSSIATGTMNGWLGSISMSRSSAYGYSRYGYGGGIGIGGILLILLIVYVLFGYGRF